MSRREKNMFGLISHSKTSTKIEPEETVHFNWFSRFEKDHTEIDAVANESLLFRQDVRSLWSAASYESNAEIAKISTMRDQEPLELVMLIVNPDPNYVADLANLFENKYDVLFASNGDDAIKLALRKSIDLIILDTNLPGESAIDVCTCLKDSPMTGNISIMLTTQEKSDEEEKLAFLAGAINYFPNDYPLDVLSHRVTEHMALVTEKKNLEIRCSTDGLTGLINKSRFNNLLNKEWHAAKRGHYPVAAIMIDIDQFKLFNDSFGHIEGDKCLKSVAAAFAASKQRDEDIAARFGGEEFAMLLPYTGINGARNIANRILANIRDLQIQHSVSAERPIVTVSAGIAVHYPSHEDNGDISPMDFLNKADANLYQAKKRGRNRWCS